MTAVLDRRVPIRHTRRRTIARVPGFGARARIRRERWTGKDALAHIVAWNQHQLRTLRCEKHDATLRGKAIDVQNRMLYRRWHRRTVREVVAALRVRRSSRGPDAHVRPARRLVKEGATSPGRGC